MENAVTEVIGGEVSYGGGLVSYLAMENSFNVIASATIFSDFSMIVAGFLIVMVFASSMLGRFHMIENRVCIENRVFKIENMAMNDTSLILIILKRDGVQLVKVSKFAELGFRGCALHLLKSQLGVSG